MIASDAEKWDGYCREIESICPYAFLLLRSFANIKKITQLNLRKKVDRSAAGCIVLKLHV